MLSSHGKEVRGSPKRRLDGHQSRTSSLDSEHHGGETENKKQAEENKENMDMDEYYSDQDSWNESVISGTSDSAVQLCLHTRKNKNRWSNDYYKHFYIHLHYTQLILKSKV